MSRTAGVRSYSATAKGLHWLVVLLVAMQFVTAIVMPHIGRQTPSSSAINLHFSLGVLILVVMGVRFAYRLARPVPLEANEARPIEQWLAKTVHRVFYLILLFGPFLGWASASSHGLSVNFFGLLRLPAIAAPGAAWGNQAGDIHALAMWTLAWLIGAHVGAALFHHFVRRDGTLVRMSPTGDR